jgi:uncharacterized phiE125 gp8 family phage protein
MLLEVVSAEAWLPVSVDDVKLSQRVLHSVEDTLIQRAIKAAMLYLERENQIAILGRKLKISLPAWPAELELPAPPLRYTSTPASAVTVSRLVEGSVTASPGLYHVVKGDQVWSIVRNSADLPTDIDEDDPAAFQVTFDVGYATAAAIPEDIQSAIILLAGHFYQNREAVIIEPRVITVPRNLEFGVKELMKFFRVQTRYVPAWAAVDA